MSKRNNKLRLFAFLVAGVSLHVGSSYAQQQSYRLTPPLRLAARPEAEVAAISTSEPDPYQPRDSRSEPTTLAAQGYCLVTLRDQQQWVPGSPKIQAIRGGRIYRFANERARGIFIASPEWYLPVLDGDCVVTSAESGERQPGRLQWGLVHQQRIFFFASQEALQQFQNEPRDYVNADLVDGGLCIVSKVDQRRTVAGLPETVAIVDGRRYFFASALHRKLFVSRPENYIGDGASERGTSTVVTVPVEENSVADSGRFGDGQSTLGTSPATLMAKSDEKNKSAKKTKKPNERDKADDQYEDRAMAGYCPVTIRTQQLWQRGKSQFKSKYDGKAYFLLGPEEQATFKENPKQFVPVLGGDSVVAFVNDFNRVPGSVFHAFIYNDRLYLFVNADEKKKFRENPGLYADADLANAGNCVVSQLDDKTEVAGLATFETVYRGMRYRFASEEYLKKFRSDPKIYADE